jgi:peptide/nickel transport system permease protein
VKKFLTKRRPITVAASIVLLVMLFFSIFGAITTPFDPYEMKARNRLQPPNLQNWFGTDNFGRDILSRVIVATRLTLGTSICALIVISFFGILIGSVSGYHRIAGAVLMRIVDGMMAFPSMLIALFLASIMGPGFITVLIAVAVVYTPRLARLVHGITLTIATNTYVSAAKAVGLGEIRILTRYVILNALSPIIVQCSFQLAQIILILAILDFLGVGFPPDVPSWGNMIATSRDYITRAPWLLIFPGVAISLTVISINILGDTLRDAFDPHAHEHMRKGVKL